MVKLFPDGSRERFLELVCSGLSVRDAAARVGADHQTGRNWWRHSGGMTIVKGRGGGLSDPLPAADPGGRALTLGERGMIQMGRRSGLSFAEIGRALGRDKSVVFREVRRNSSPDGVYYASVAHTKAHQGRRRPKPFMLQDPALSGQIEAWMDVGWSPKIIAQALREGLGADQTWRVSHETIYQALYVQTRGSLRANLAQKLSLKRTKRVSAATRKTASPSPYKDAFTISQRPAEATDRAVPGHWEGDLIIGSNSSAIGTLVERSTRFVVLLHLPGRHTADEVATAMIREMGDLPEHLRRSITWDRGTELADYRRIQIALNAPVFFCDPHSPWQRGSNENTNRLLRFWFEKGTDLRQHTAEDLQHIAATLNQRPRPTLDFQTPATRLNQLLTAAKPPRVA